MTKFIISGPEVEHLKGGVNCRPGRLGIVAGEYLQFALAPIGA